MSRPDARGLLAIAGEHAAAVPLPNLRLAIGLQIALTLKTSAYRRSRCRRILKSDSVAMGTADASMARCNECLEDAYARA